MSDGPHEELPGPRFGLNDPLFGASSPPVAPKLPFEQRAYQVQVRIEFIGAVALGTMGALQKEKDFSRKSFSKEVSVFPEVVAQQLSGEGDIVAREVHISAEGGERVTFLQRRRIGKLSQADEQRIGYVHDLAEGIVALVQYSLDRPEERIKPQPEEVKAVAAFVGEHFTFDRTPSEAVDVYSSPATHSPALRGALKDARFANQWLDETHRCLRIDDGWWLLQDHRFPDRAHDILQAVGQQAGQGFEDHWMVARVSTEGALQVEFGRAQPTYDEQLSAGQQYGFRVDASVVYTMSAEDESEPPTRKISVREASGIAVAHSDLPMLSDMEVCEVTDALRTIFPRSGPGI